MSRKEELFSIQNKSLRHPGEIFGADYKSAGITGQTLSYQASPSFVRLLADLRITLFISREYENLLLALNGESGKELTQSFFHLPHPSGIAADRKRNRLYVAATRNPNAIIEFRCTRQNLTRLKVTPPELSVLVPSRAKYYPGQYYFHDLVVQRGKLYANSVGMNSVVAIDMGTAEIEKPVWWPKCIERKGKPDFKANYIQLNSIALGKTLQHSYFSASGARISARRPGHHNFPVNGTGVIFSGKNREAILGGLTRPHSARLHDGKIWVANSGYGEVGYYKQREFTPAFKFNGWTRGLCFVGNILFVGVSRVLPRFRHYAPGISTKRHVCSVVAIDIRQKKVIGSVRFPYGNQIFGIDYLPSGSCKGFPFRSIKKGGRETDIFAVSI
jgi:uncharacterized protein (TIGR03032 family)